MSCSEWKEGYLKDIANITMGQSPKGATCNTVANGTPLLNGPTEFGQHHPYPVQFTIEPKKICEPGDLLFCVRGSTVGRMNWADTNYAIGRGLAFITPKIPGTNHFIKGVLEFKLGELLSISNGSTFPNITRSMLTDIKINIPSINEIMKISKILETIDNKIELNNEMNKTLEKMSESLFKRWFIDFEFPNEDGQPYKSSGGEMIESGLGMIPKGWDTTLLGNILEITSGKRPKNKSKEKDIEFTIPLIGASSIMGYTNDVLYNDKILVIGRVGTHGIVQRFNEDVWPSDNTFVIKSKYYEYVNQVLSNIDYSALNVGSTQPLITQTDIKNLEIVQPNLSVINKFELIVSSFYKIIENNKENNYCLERTRDIILPKLMNGEIAL